MNRLSLAVTILTAAFGSVALAQPVDISRGRTSVALDVETLGSVGLTISGLSDDVTVPGSLDGSVAFGINRPDAASPLLPTTFSYDAASFLTSLSGSIEHAGTLDLDFDGTPITVGNFTIAFDAGRVGGDASGFFVASTVGLTGPLFDFALGEVEPTPRSLDIAGDLLVSPELAATLGNAALAGVDVGDAAVAAAPDVGIAGGTTSVVLDTATLEVAGLTLSSVSEEVIAPGSLAGSVAFAINARETGAPALPTTFAFDPNDFSTTFSGTIEHVGSVLFNDDMVEVGDFTIGFDNGRISATNSGFFVTSTTGLAGAVFDVASADLSVHARETGSDISGDLLVSSELADVLGDAGLTGVDVGDFLVEGFASSLIEVNGGQTSVALDLDTLDAVGLVLSGASEDVIAEGSIEGSVAFPINGRDAATPAVATTFVYDPTDFLGSFDGTIEHIGSLFFNEDATELGSFTIGFDPTRVGDERSGFFVASTVGIMDTLFDAASADLAVIATDTSLQIDGDLLVSAELAMTLGDAGLAGASIGEFAVQSVPVPEPDALAAGFAVTLAFALLGRGDRGRER